MTENEISQLPLPTLNKMCREHGVPTDLGLLERRKALFAAMTKKAAKPEKTEKAAPKMAAPAKAAPKSAKPAPVVEDDDEEEEAPKKPSKATPTKGPSTDDRVSNLESSVAELAKGQAAILALLQKTTTKDEEPVATKEPVKKPAPAKKPTKAAEPEPEDDDEDEETEVPDHAKPYIKATADGFELNLQLEQVDTLKEPTLRFLLEALGEDVGEIAKGQVRKLQGQLRELLKANQSEEDEESDEDDEATEEEIAEAEELVAEAESLPETRQMKRKDIMPNRAVAYTDPEDGTVYAAVIADSETYGEPEDDDLIRITFQEDATAVMDVEIATLKVSVGDPVILTFEPEEEEEAPKKAPKKAKK